MQQYDEQSKVIFKGDNLQYSAQSFQSTQPRSSKITQWTIKCSGGLIKNENQANVVLLGFALVVIVVSLVLVFGGGHIQQKSTTASIKQMKQFMNTVHPSNK